MEISWENDKLERQEESHDVLGTCGADDWSQWRSKVR